MTASNQELLARRARRLGPNVQTFYDEPIQIVKGEGVWLWDETGRRYLDCYNNVPHVGHCHPRVVEAICKQAATLNTHTRYLHGKLLDYIEMLTATFDSKLSNVAMTCTGSEANDVALRVAQAVTGKKGFIATNHTYHGNTWAVSQLSRTNEPKGGAPSNYAFVPAPDSYRPLGGVGGTPHALAFAAEVQTAISALEDRGQGFAALVICPFFANEGFPDLGPDWLLPTIDVVRRAGGLIIADEVQPGFGRLGSHMWAHQRMGFVPDIVTLGKSLANGHPVGAMVTTPDNMKAFRSSFRYFNTFGGNAVSAAAAMATFEVLRDEGLMQNAKDVGAYAKLGMQELAKRHQSIGDVRGCGLFMGAELVTDRATKTPAVEYTKKIVNEMRRQGVLLNFLGVHYNTLKIRPPMPFSRANTDQFLSTLDKALSTIPLQ
jgi:4-aminobutyrate aminotransferase-like enzyme